MNRMRYSRRPQRQFIDESASLDAPGAPYRTAMSLSLGMDMSARHIISESDESGNESENPSVTHSDKTLPRRNNSDDQDQDQMLLLDDMPISESEDEQCDLDADLDADIDADIDHISMPDPPSVFGNMFRASMPSGSADSSNESGAQRDPLVTRGFEISSDSEDDGSQPRKPFRGAPSSRSISKTDWRMASFKRKNSPTPVSTTSASSTSGSSSSSISTRRLSISSFLPNIRRKRKSKNKSNSEENLGEVVPIRRDTGRGVDGSFCELSNPTAHGDASVVGLYDDELAISALPKHRRLLVTNSSANSVQVSSVTMETILSPARRTHNPDLPISGSIDQRMHERRVKIGRELHERNERRRERRRVRELAEAKVLAKTRQEALAKNPVVFPKPKQPQHASSKTSHPVTPQRETFRDDERKCSNNAAQADASERRENCCERSCSSCKWLFIFATLLFVFSVASVGVGVYIILQPGKGSDDPKSDDNMLLATESPSSAAAPQSAISLKMTSFFEMLRPHIPDMELPMDPDSPRYKALEWISTKDKFADGFIKMDADEDDTFALMERYVLVLFYFSTGPWKDEVGFLNDTSVCDWNVYEYGELRGITCSSIGAVDGIRIPFNTLQGSLPKELKLLTHLETLVLNDNNLDGVVPKSMAELLDLRLQNNKLTGTLDFLASSLSLSHLNLSNNQLSGCLPRAIGEELLDLEILSLRDYSNGDGLFACTIPAALGNLASLQVLDLGANAHIYQRIPEELSQLSNSLSVLALDETSISGTLPIELGQLVYLREWHLQNNALLTGTVPSQYVSMSQLQLLFLDRTGLIGSLDDVFCNEEKGVQLSALWADCLGDPPQIECACCSACCTSETGICEEF